MHRATAAASLALVLIVPGCLDALPLRSAPDEVVGPAIAAASGAVARGGAPLLWEGRELTAASDGSTACGSGNCERVPFEVTYPDGWWTERTGGLLVAIRWDYEGVDVDHDFRPEVDFHLVVHDAAGALVAEGERGWFASVAWLDAPAAGAYEAVVVATRGAGVYAGAVQVEARVREPGPPRDLLPNVVTLPLVDLQVEYPNSFLFGMLVPQPVAEATLGTAGIRGCGVEEHLESGVKRCLRFSNAVGNAGEGTIEVRLPASAMAAGGDFLQRVYASDGSFREEPAGRAVYHPAHGHYHYEGFAAVTLHRFDLDAGARGEVVVEGDKLGYCFFDIGLVALGHPGTVPPRYGVDGCLNPFGEGALVMGVSPGWFDLYAWGLSHQYIDITDVEDGVYELVSVANADGRLIESDAADNEASVVFRLTGDEVEVLRR